MSLHKHRSRVITDGIARAPHRAFLRATGLDERDFDRSFIGIVTTAGENTPCSMSLMPQADQARLGVAAAGGIPITFSTISVSDGTSMNHPGMRMSLVSREVIADSVEVVVRAHGYDGLVAFAGCDKTLPALMMAMVRLNVPSVFVFGGAMLPGRLASRGDVTILDTIEAVGSVQSGTMSLDDLTALERACSPTVGEHARSKAVRSSRDIVPDWTLPTASMVSRIVTSPLDASRPGNMAPPKTKTDGTLSLTIAIINAGRVLSQPAKTTSPSYP